CSRPTSVQAAVLCHALSSAQADPGYCSDDGHQWKGDLLQLSICGIHYARGTRRRLGARGIALCPGPSLPTRSTQEATLEYSRRLRDQSCCFEEWFRTAGGCTH